ncbi:STAS domain-containing protein [Amycolatopsis sp. OK19-0408]|uniref:STAS domain-containing protein n=1 Tax=Amycolatopsis iheyensis TaxID=2945988 RepID=A0A9X2SIL1_9PSEU|nr:STAS domain-containing protein [Amycolatopsis iheyensis]MCR6481916.1 STAS domain-containing protein [Amycolatopsis iheyensis]
MTAPTFDVITTAEASEVAAGGDLDLAVTGRLETLLRRELRLKPPALVFDASAVTFCGARVLTVLLNTTADARRLGVPFALAGRRRALLRPITALGLDRALPVQWSTAEALAWLALVPRLS